MTTTAIFESLKQTVLLLDKGGTMISDY